MIRVIKMIGSIDFKGFYPFVFLKQIVFRYKTPLVLMNNKHKPSDFFGTLNEEEGNKMQEYLIQSRNEEQKQIRIINDYPILLNFEKNNKISH